MFGEPFFTLAKGEKQPRGQFCIHIDKQNIECTYKGLSFSLEEEAIGTGYSVERNKPDTEKQIGHPTDKMHPQQSDP